MTQRSEQLYPYFWPLSRLQGVGPRLETQLAKLLGDSRLKDMVFHLPIQLINRELLPNIASATPGEVGSFKVQIQSIELSSRKSRTPSKIIVGDDTAFLTLLYFHGDPNWIEKRYPIGELRIISGRVEEQYGARQIAHPDYVLEEGQLQELPCQEPVYPLTAGVTNLRLQKYLKEALALLPDLPEWLDPNLIRCEHWQGFLETLKQLHWPVDETMLDNQHALRRRLAYDELLVQQLALQLARCDERQGRTPLPMQNSGKLRQKILQILPFTPTQDQLQAADEIRADMAGGQAMSRLLQGDVGSGKTLVAAMAIADLVEVGGQACLMAPTEILARQHAQGLKPLLAHAGIKLELLTGRDKGKARQAKLIKLAQGDIDLLCGTHAVFQEDVVFKNLQLAIIDEQHRFGVRDREKLMRKGLHPHCLVMTATPIPRTLSLALFGDIDSSIIREKPPGRKSVKTSAINVERMAEIIEAMKRVLARKENIYWVCPLVEESEKLDLMNAQERFAFLVKIFGEEVGLVHGQMSGDEKDKALAAFRDGKTPILVSTTVIEVGMDVPNATVIIVEHAERFGLAQLHQLRGRVGRSERASACILAYQAPLSASAKKRLDILRRSEDGFFIAEEDLKLRGAGEILGVKQAGVPDYHFARFPGHADLLHMAAKEAKLILHRDPELRDSRGEALRLLLGLFEHDFASSRLKSG